MDYVTRENWRRWRDDVLDFAHRAGLTAADITELFEEVMPPTPVDPASPLPSPPPVV